MIFTTKGRYATMAMVDLALFSEGKPVSLQTIADRQEIDRGYLEQIFLKLRANNLITSVKGPGGGYMLARSTSDINVADIMLAVDEEIKMTRCDSEAGCMKDKKICVTHHLWCELENNLLSFLRGVALSDLVSRNLKIKGC